MKQKLSQQDIQKYNSMYDIENLEQIFRYSYEKYNSAKIDKPNNTVEFVTDIRPDIFPQTYMVEAQEKQFCEVWNNSGRAGTVILKDGKIIYESYTRGNTAETYHIEQSVTKSIGSLMFGHLYERGLIADLNVNVTQYIPELKNTGYDGVTIQHLLDMTTGIDYTEVYDDMDSDVVRLSLAFLDGSVDDYAKTLGNATKPGSYHKYASIDSHILAWVFRKATGKSYVALFDEILWTKIGAESNAYLLLDQTDNVEATGGACMRLRDLARIGQMVANGGVAMTGQRVVSERWIQQSITPNSPQTQVGANAESEWVYGYKNQWWIPTNRQDNEFLAIGVYGQWLYINPLKNIVIAINGVYKQYNERLEQWTLDYVAAIQALAQKIG